MALVHELIDSKQWATLMEMDQLKVTQEDGCAFAGFREGEITWAPTFKVRRCSDVWCPGPSWGESRARLTKAVLREKKKRCAERSRLFSGSWFERSPKGHLCFKKKST